MIPAPSDRTDAEPPLAGWRLRLYTVIFENDTRAGRAFDIALIGLILFSVAVVVADSMPRLQDRWHGMFTALEWLFTVLFTVEYLARLVCLRHPLRYALSFFGIVDLLALLPTYLALFFPELHVLIDVRVLRLMRVFRIFKLTAYMSEYQSLGRALRASRRKITVFVTAVAMVVLVLGTVMYVIEGPANGFDSIVTAVYWAATTMTTTGYGDITPKTELGRIITSLMMLLGWGTLAVPTGIVTAEITSQRLAQGTAAARRCADCLAEGHLPEARFCHHCGAALPAQQQQP